MIVLGATDAGEEDFFLVGLQVSVGVDQEEHLVGTRDESPRSFAVRSRQHADAVGRVHIFPLVKHARVEVAVIVDVLQNQDAVALQPLRKILVGEAAIVEHLAHPHPPQMVDVDVCRVGHHRL